MELEQRQALGTIGKAEQRQHRILDLVAEHSQVFVNDLADGLGVSKETIRRDLFQLDSHEHRAHESDDGRGVLQHAVAATQTEIQNSDALGAEQ